MQKQSIDRAYRSYILFSNMNQRNKKDCRKRRLALIGLLTWCSTQQQNNNIVFGRNNRPSIQHRVKRSRRLVKYGLNNNEGAAHARTNHIRRETTRNDARRLHREDHPKEDSYWVYPAFDNHPTYQTKTYNDFNDNINESGFFRSLFDQFVGEELPPSDGFGTESDNLLSNVGSNVTAEVEFESALESNQSVFDKVGEMMNSQNTTATAIVGNTNDTTGHTTESVVYTKGDSYNNASNTSTPEEEESQFQPLRMRAILAEDSGKGGLLNDTEREILFYEMLSPALLAWSSSLRVDPVVGNLTVDVDQLLDGETCGPGIDSGLPSIRVPLLHTTEGIPETDMIVYLSLGFTEKSNHNVTFNETIHYKEANWTSKDREDEKLGNSVHSNREGLGEVSGRVKERLPLNEFGGVRRQLTTVSDSMNFRDLPPSSLQSKNVTNETAINICTGDYLAAASYCSTDQYDRPTAALLHICIDAHFFDEKYRRRNIMTLIHELGHALGFNALSMAHFRRPDGTPYTERDEDGNVPDATVECTGPEAEHQLATLPLPSSDVLQFKNVRGGVRVAEIVTPSVLQVVRNQFDCQLLTGAELESSEGNPLSTLEGAGCIGDHWERRLFSSDVMNPIVDDIEYSTRISTLTLAYFADSGWYQVDLSNADVASGWGRGAGCNFVNDTCINEFGDVPPQNAPFFCNEVSEDDFGLSLAQNIHGCTPDLSRKAKCSIGQYDLDLPAAYQYFNSTYGSDVGGSDTLMDFCPVYDGYDNGLCSSSASEAVIRANEVERFGLRNSRCLVGSVFPFERSTALCLPIACVLEDRSLRIKVGEDWHICDFADQMIPSGSVNITCPDPRRICPTFFCPYDCLGTGGECDYNTGKCLCRYKNATHPEETFLDACGIVQEVKETENITATKPTKTRRPIIQRKGTIDSLMPPSDAKISDYYVSDVLHLDDRPHFIDGWGILILAMTALTLLSFFVVLFLFRDPLKDATSKTFDTLMFWRRKEFDSGDDDGHGGDGNIDGHTREKHKMVASVLVDMRIRESDNQNTGLINWRRRRRGRDAVNESLAETDGRMTDSEIASSAPPAMSDSMSEISSRQLSELEVDLAIENEGGGVDLLSEGAAEAPPVPQPQPPVMRQRRRFVPNLFS